jgi:tetratricopeptide (TPR) repeat protein
VVLLVGVSVLAAAQARRRPWLAAGWTWYLVALAPVIGIVQVGTQARADRYTYVPLVGVFAIIAWGVPDLLERLGPPSATGRRRALAVAAGISIAALSIAAHLQTRFWRDGETLVGRALAVTEDNAVAHVGMGLARLRQGRPHDAVASFGEALRISPNYPAAHVNAAVVFVTIGDTEQAIEHYRRAIDLLPADADLRVGLGDAEVRAGRPEAAVEQYRSALAIDPEHAVAQRQLGIALLGSDDTVAEGVDLLVRAVATRPEDATAHRALVSAHRKLGLVYARRGRYADAIEQWTAALALEPDHEATRRNLERARRMLAGGP